MTAKTETQGISLQFDLPFAPEKVWRALTDPKLLAQWLMSSDLIPEVGQSFSFRQEPTQWWDGIVNGEVLVADRPKKLSYTWKGGPEVARLDTVVTWTLTATASGTRLDLEHTGFEPNAKFAYEGAKQGWSQKVGEAMLQVLKELA